MPEETRRKFTPQTSLLNLKKEAKRWLQALRAHDELATARFRRVNPKAPNQPGLRDVQHALALEYGLSGWTELKTKLTTLAAETADPGVVDSFLRMACLDWRVGGPDRSRLTFAAGRLWTRHPEIARHNIFTAVVCGDLSYVEQELSRHPESASTTGGPRNWPPLLYLCDARLREASTSVHSVEISRLLLDRGADPNVYYPGGDPMIHYTALTAVMGRGEEQASMHPHAKALAALLLERGADPSDGQVFYNLFAGHASQRHLGDEAIWLLELMYGASVARGRKSDWDDSNWSIISMGGYGLGARYLLSSAIAANHFKLAEWVLAHGANPDAPPAPGRKMFKGTLYEEAISRGRTAFAQLLLRYGATPPTAPLSDEDAFVSACMNLDRAQADTLLARHPEFLQWEKPMDFAAELNRADVVRFLLDLGVSPNVEASKGGGRPLHTAAYHDAPDAARLLLESGADPDFTGNDYGASALAIALWGQKPRMVEMLSRISRDVWALTTAGKLDRLREVLKADPRLAKVTYENQTPLFWLPEDEKRAAKMAELFLAYGLDPDLRNEKGETAADRAEARGLDEAARILRSGADPRSAEQVLLKAINAGELALVESIIRKHEVWFRENRPQYIDIDAQTLIARAQAPRKLSLRPDLEALEREVAALTVDGLSLDEARLKVARTFGVESWDRLAQACRLIDAIWRDDLETVRTLVVQNPRLLHEHASIRDSNWGPPMSFAANLGRDAIIEMLHGFGAKDLEHALGRATLQSKIGTARMLYRKLGSPPPPEGSLGGPAYTLSVTGTELMLELGARVLDEEGNNLAPVAVVLESDSRRPADKHRILELYVEHGVELPDTPVMALHRGRIDLLEEQVRRDPKLLERTFTHDEIYPPEWDCRSEVETQGTPLDGATLLHLCVDYDEIDIARWLLDRGMKADVKAAVDADGFGGQTALFGAVVCYANFWGNYNATAEDSPFARLLLESGADPNARASIRKKAGDGILREYRDVTPLAWGEQYVDKILVSLPAMRIIAEHGGHS